MERKRKKIGVIERKRKGRRMKNNFFIVVDCFLGDDLSKVFATKNKSFGDVFILMEKVLW